MTSRIAFTLNGKPTHIDFADARTDHFAATPTGTTLSQWLRANGHTGTKEGCAEGDCGACSVLVSSTDATGAPVWRSVCSCISLLPQLDGRAVVTAEGLAQDGLHPVQAAMVHNHGSQCGYCTPGFICSMAEGYARASLRSDDAAGISAQLAGNLCRCTGYRPIRDAMSQALAFRDGAADADLVRIGAKKSAALPAPPPPPTRTLDIEAHGHRFLAPASLEELLRLWAVHPQARIVAGATEVGVWLRKRNQVEQVLLSTDRVDVMHNITVSHMGIHIGGAATLTQLEEALAHQPAYEVLRTWLEVFAARTTRNRATVAGNLVTASPIGDLAPLLMVMDAEVELQSVRGVRNVALHGFFTGYRQHVMAADEVMTRIAVPTPTGTVRAYKVSKRREMDISTVSAAFHWHADDEGNVVAARAAFGGVAATPVRLSTVEAVMIGRSTTDAATFAATIDVLDAAAQAALTPLGDVRGSSDARRSVVRGLIAKAWRGEASEADAGPVGAVLHATKATLHEVDDSRDQPHDSARLHVTGAARYVDDIAARKACAEMWPVQAKLAHARIVAIDAGEAQAMPGVLCVLTGHDVVGSNNVGPIRADEPLLPVDEVQFASQVVALVVAHTQAQARAAAAKVKVSLEPVPAILGIAHAHEHQRFHNSALPHGAWHTQRKGNPTEALQRAPRTLRGSLVIGGQEHFYLESQAAVSEVGDAMDVVVHSSTQHPSEVQAMVAHVLHLPRHQVVVHSPRMGGGFGGKETQASSCAAWTALAAWKLAGMGIHKPVRLQLDRDIDMETTGKRHPFRASFEVGFQDDGRITAVRCELDADGGFALDLSESIHDRAMFHFDNCYNIENVEVKGKIAATNVVSHTAFRGFGGPQGMLAIEDIMARVALACGLDAAVVRERNFYPSRGAHTHYHQAVDDFRIPPMWRKLQDDAGMSDRRGAVAAFNAGHVHVKRGLAITPVKFGISFTASFLNQASAWLLIYRDGSVQVNHGGTEMGQGLYAKVHGIVMRTLGLSSSRIRMMPTATDKVPNTSATAASSGADLNGAAVLLAAEELRRRLAPVAASLLDKHVGRPVSAHDVVFADDHVTLSMAQAPRVPFSDVAEAAYVRGVSLSSHGFYRTPDIFYDRATGTGKPFHYFAYGVCCAEVELDGHTGMKTVRRVDIIHDVGNSLHPHIDVGQVEGGFVQGMGWLTGEELKWNADGKLLTHSASTYAIPTIGDTPHDFRVRLWDEHATQPGVVHGSKAVGEPPLMLAIAVREALRDAVAAFGADASQLPSPLTHEALRMSVASSMKGQGR
jgi:xanthine dehydrogenase molybdopterin binding subunit/xanthine dehydrogenase small subunit